MVKFTPGERVAVPCEVSSGPFPTEKLVTVSTINGPVSGFAQVSQMPDGHSLSAVVQEGNAHALKVRLQGSFFTTNGMVEVQPGNVKHVG
jgi:hypothetical protein